MILQPSFWIFLATSVVVYWLLPVRARMGFLALASFGYLASIEPTSISVLAAWTSLFYIVPNAFAKGRIRNAFVPGIVIAILGYLVFFKYLPPLVRALAASDQYSIVVPIGLSYYTFKLIHYAVEVARGNIVDRSPTTFFCYIFLLPIFTAGPIERYDHFLENREDKWNRDSAVAGITRIIHGLIKKFILAEGLLHINQTTFGTLDSVLGNLAGMQTIEIWGFLILIYLYAYMDFSAYTDIAIGASRLFGLGIMENFNFPILAPNISDFWRRWHISLARWCQSYIYLPMIGITRNPYLGVMATFTIIGVWHAGTMGWLLWGLFHGLGVSVFVTWQRAYRRKQWTFLDNRMGHWAGVVTTFLFVSASYSFTVIHARADFMDGIRLLAKLVAIDLPA